MALLRSGRLRLLLALTATVALLAPIGWMWWSSRLPDTYDMAEMGYADHGGGPAIAAPHHGTPVADLVEAPAPAADVDRR